jgi:hypothetical protein
VSVKKRNDGKKDKNPAAVALGRLGGLKGGPATAAKLTPAERQRSARRAGEASGRTRMNWLTAAQRKAIASKAAKARWAKKRKESPHE